MNGRMRWSRLENLFEEGSKSQDYDPAQVRRMPPCPASLPLVHPETAHALRWGGDPLQRASLPQRVAELQAFRSRRGLDHRSLPTAAPPHLATVSALHLLRPLVHPCSSGCWQSGCAARAGARCASRWRANSSG